MSNMNDLEDRIAAAKAQHEALNPKHVPPQSGKEMAMGIRAFMEMFGVLLGTGIVGYALDSYFDTSPTLLIIFIILGFITAVFNLYKLSKNLGTAIGSNSLQLQDKMARKSPENESQS